MYDIEEMYQPTTLEEALELTAKFPDAILIAGGTDVLISIREGRLAGCSLISLHELDELKGISRDEKGTIRIKSGTCFADIIKNDIIQRYIPTLASAVDTVGGPQIREMGTIGGNVSNGVTSADSATTLLTLNAKLELKSIRGTRIVPLTEWYAGPGKTVRESDEIVTSILIEQEDYEGYYGSYYKYGKRNAMEIATLGCSVSIKLSAEKDKVDDFRIAYGVAGPVPMRCFEVEQLVKHQIVSDELLKVIEEGALAETKPRDSWRASKAFREQLISELGRRATIQAIENAGGNSTCLN